MRCGNKVSVLAKRLMALGVTVLVLILLCAGLALAFTDVIPGGDYSEAIEELSSLGIIGGFQDGSFRPGELVTRQQFAKMIVLTLGLPVSESNVCPFSDVQRGGYSDPFFPDNYIAVAAAQGITKGLTSTSFGPSKNITRAQVMSMVVRAAGIVGVALSQPTSAYYGDTRYTMRNFTDSNHGLNAQIAEVSGLLWGIRLDRAGVWDPYKNATRGEVAQILWRLSQKLGPSTTTTTFELPTANQLAGDDFSDPDSGWGEGSYSDATIRYSGEGDYEMSILSSGTAYGSWWPHQQFDDAYFEAWAYPSPTSGSWEYGLMFRHQDMDRFYELSVTGDGTAALWKSAADGWTKVSQSVNLPPLAGDGWRHLEVFMFGNYFTAYVDGTAVGEFTDDDYVKGNVGFYVGTFDSSRFTAYFDDFAVWGLVY